MSAQVRYKGRLAKANVVNRLKKNQQTGLQNRNSFDNAHPLHDSSNGKTLGESCIVDLKVMQEKMRCAQCQEGLLMTDFVRHHNKGLAATLVIKCKNRNLNVDVPTGYNHLVNKDARNFLPDKFHNDATSKAVLGAYHAGVGRTELNKILACLDLPVIHPSVYRKYEREVGPAIEKQAKLSCNRAAKEERRLIIQNIQELEKELPPELSALFDNVRLDVDTSTEEFDKSLSILLNIIVSYDMGWSRRATGKSYNSKNGKAPETHDCLRNCPSSSKAMEASVGTELVLKSQILKENNMKVQVLIGDEDSTLMASISNADPNHGIRKLADNNHVLKNFSKKIYLLRTSHSELNKKGLIAHIKKCFTYAVAQNRRDTKKLASTIHTIVDHLYNKHENCGEWCRAGREGSLYKPKFVIKSEALYEPSRQIFAYYANGASKLSIKACSQGNESWNNSVAHKFAGNKSYSTSSSGDTRVATVVLTFNDCESFMNEVKEEIGVKSSQRSKNFYASLDDTKHKKSLEAQSIAKKRRRIELVNNTNNLQKSLEKSEGCTYQSNIGFESAGGALITQDDSTENCEDLVASLKSLSNTDCLLVCFDLETTGRSNDSEILQIAAIFGNCVFSVYITPTKNVDDAAYKINLLTAFDDRLFYKGNEVMTLSLESAPTAFYTFLKQIPRKSVLVAHNAGFDTKFLIRDLKKCSLLKKFSTVIYGVCDSLALFRKKYPERKKGGMCTLSKLAGDLLEIDKSGTEFHEASFDVRILQSLMLFALNFAEYTADEIMSKSTRFVDVVQKKLVRKMPRCKEKNSPKPFLAFKGLISEYMMKKFSKTEMSYEDLISLYKLQGGKTIVDFMSDSSDGKPKVTKDRKVIDKVVSHFKVTLANQQ
ncbi:hypothetical protein QAD02_008435 [Eretmocerus hayati]|uniref:Uncharacterized protein n=1 Tax=Eretmocerus hayati TaxID=131215 RepID=A0ACC2N6G4_9HYME|nr:hypothetical protein QAD02_008435 [Eretmocerus hayati]